MDFGIISGTMSALATLFVPFLKITIQLCVAFVILIWFSLSLIYAATKIIDFLLGQPFVGWLITGNINAPNDMSILTQQGMFSLTAPIMQFLYVGMIVSAFLFIVYFIYTLLPISWDKGIGPLWTRAKGIIGISLAFIWIPFTYSILVITTNGLMIGLYAFLNVDRSKNNFVNDYNNLKSKAITNLNLLRDTLLVMEVKKVDPNAGEFESYLNTLSSERQFALLQFTDAWNNNFANSLITPQKIDLWIQTVGMLDFNNLSKVTLEQKEALNSLSSASNKMVQMLSYYSIWVRHSHNEISIFNSFFFTPNSISAHPIDLNNFLFDDNFLIYNQIGDGVFLNTFARFVNFNGSFTDTNFSQSLVNILYSMAIGRNEVFIAGWDYSMSNSFSIAGMIPWEMKITFVNLTYLSYNIKVLAIGSIINSIMLPAIFIFTLTLLKRFVYIAFWPIMILIAFARNAQGENKFVRYYINELFYKTINIIGFALMWNFVAVISIAIYNAINKSNVFSNELWIKDVLNVFVVIGIVVASFMVIKTFLSAMEEDRSSLTAGASEVAAAKNKMESQVSKQKGQANKSFSQAGKKFNKNESVKAFKKAFNENRGKGFSARFAAGKMQMATRGQKGGKK